MHPNRPLTRSLRRGMTLKCVGYRGEAGDCASAVGGGDPPDPGIVGAVLCDIFAGEGGFADTAEAVQRRL